MSIRAYRILKQELETAPTFTANENDEAYCILKSLNCHSEVQTFSITKEVIEQAKRKAMKYETLETLVEMERVLMFSDDKSIEYLCK
jgi:hypothetical protein